jgi:hypothetical protein
MAIDRSSAGTGGFQVQHDVLESAASTQVPDQVQALGDIRKALLARTVDPAAFGEVDFSAEAGKAHLDNVQNGADTIESSQGKLDGIGQDIGGTTQQTREMDDEQKRKQEEQTAQLAQAPEQAQGQRDKALAVLKRISAEHPVSVATVAKRPLEWLTDKAQWSDWVRNVESGQIGDHYEKDVPDLLAQPPTDRNLRALANTETEFWQSDRGSKVGGWVSADQRYEWLWQARDSWLSEMSLEDEANIRWQIGVPRD